MHTDTMHVQSGQHRLSTERAPTDRGGARISRAIERPPARPSCSPQLHTSVRDLPERLTACPRRRASAHSRMRFHRRPPAGRDFEMRPQGAAIAAWSREEAAPSAHGPFQHPCRTLSRLGLRRSPRDDAAAASRSRPAPAAATEVSMRAAQHSHCRSGLLTPPSLPGERSMIGTKAPSSNPARALPCASRCRSNSCGGHARHCE